MLVGEVEGRESDRADQQSKNNHFDSRSLPSSRSFPRSFPVVSGFSTFPVECGKVNGIRKTERDTLSIGSAMKKSLVTDSAGWCFSVYSASTRIQYAQTERRKLLRICKKIKEDKLRGRSLDL